jgi:hypothetical protein
MAGQEGNDLDSGSNRESFQHVITAHVKTDQKGKEYIKFSTYLSFLQLTFRVYIPDEGDRTTVYVDFRLNRRATDTLLNQQ